MDYLPGVDVLYRRANPPENGRNLVPPYLPTLDLRVQIPTSQQLQHNKHIILMRHILHNLDNIGMVHLAEALYIPIRLSFGG